MLKAECEKLIKRILTAEQYQAIEILYMDSLLDKVKFCKALKPIIKAIPLRKTERKVIQIGVTDRAGNFQTPNNCWWHTKLVEVVDVDIKSGKTKVKEIPNSYDCRYKDSTYLRHDEVEFVEN